MPIETLRTPPLSIAPAPGYAVPAISPKISPLAPLVRANLIAGNPQNISLPRPERVLDQADVPCCVSCALAGAMQILHPEWPELAPLFHYFVTRFDNHAADQNGFLLLQPAISTLAKQGICRFDLHPQPFTTVGATTRPAPAAFTDASTRRLRGLFASRSLPGPTRVVRIREELRKGCPVVVGITLPKSYPDSFLDSKFEWNDPSTPLGSAGHCLLVVEASDSRNGLLVQDSRGPREFDRGCWRLGYRVVDSFIVREAYSVIGK